MKKICFSLLVLLLGVCLYPILHNYEVPLTIKMLDFRYRASSYYAGASLSTNISRENHQRFHYYFSPPVTHSPEILIERLLIPSKDSNHLIPVNIYVNKTLLTKNGPKLPSIVYIHGGGWVFAPPDSLFYERFTRQGLVFIEIKYRLAPENKFPVPLQDCFDAILNETIFKYTNMEKLAIMGDSAGANLVSGLIYYLKDQKTPIFQKIKCQILIYPACGTLDPFPSKEKYKNWYILDENNMLYYMLSYSRDFDDFEYPYFNIMRRDNMNGLPESYFILAERDYLFSEGEEYAKMLKNSGNKVTVKKYNIEHSFFKLGLKESLEAYDGLVEFLKERNLIEN